MPIFVYVWTTRNQMSPDFQLIFEMFGSVVTVKINRTILWIKRESRL